MQVKDQMPCDLSPVRPLGVSDAFDGLAAVRETVVEPLLASRMRPADPVTVVADDGTDMGPDDVASMVARTLEEDLDPDAEAFVNDMLRQSLLTWNDAYGLPMREMFLVQDAVASALPAPTPTTVYTAREDVIPAAKAMLARNCSPAFWRASLGLFARAQTLCACFVDEDAFEGFKAYVRSQVALMQAAGNLDTATTTLFSAFDALKLDKLTESLSLRKGPSDPDAALPYSFARLLQRFVADHVQQVGDPYVADVLPFDVLELVVPSSIVFVNVERHAKAKASAVREEWDIIGKSLASPVRIVSKKKLAKLTTAERAARKAGQPSRDRRGLQAERSRELPFAGKPPSPKKTVARIKRIADKLSMVNLSQNPIKVTHRSFNRPSRRDPDNPNKMGLSTATRYRPDIHVYLDTSGSISEDNYRDAMVSIIALARKMDVDLYFNSFSHIMSDCTLLQTRGRSVRQIYNQLRKVPKVSGGTDFAQIWRYIQASKQRRRELSIMITDFGYCAPSRPEEHPKNLYYAPCSTMDWQMMVSSAEGFLRSMRHIAADLRSRILM